MRQLPASYFIVCIRMSYGSIKIMVILRAIDIFRNFKTCSNVYLRCVRHFSFTAEPIAYLTNCGVSKHVIDDNAFLADLKIDSLHSKLEILRQMRPRHIDDFVPLMKIEEETLREVAWKAIGEYDAIPERHRIYYISRELQIAPVTVSKFCSRHETIFFDEFAGIAEKLKILMDYNVDSVQILQSLYVLDSSKNNLFSRLDEMSRRSHGYRPWYFKLTDDEFRKVIDAQVKNTKEISVESTHRLRKRNLQKSVIVTEINELLSCDDETSTHIYYNSIDNMEQLSPAKRIYRLLADNGVGAQCVQSNSVVLTLPYDQVNHNLELIKGMRPHSIDDFLPLIAIETRSLQAFALEVNKRDIDLHPVYLFSRKLNIAPAIVSKHFAKDSKLFFKQNFDGMVKKLDVLVAYNVDPMSILRSPNTFRYSAAEIETRLEQFKADGIDNVSSWMIVVDKSRSKISVAKKVEEKTVLGGCADTVDYLAARLNWDAAARSRALKQYPSLVKCSAIKVKNHVDYLLNETHFTINDITSNVAVFRTNLDELKQRMDEMAAIGLVPRKLYAVCLARQSYLDMVRKFCERKNCSVAFEAFKSIEKRVKNVKDD